MRVVRKPDGREYHYAGHYGGAPRIYAEPFTLEYFAEIAEKQSPAPEIPHNQVRRLIAEFRAGKLDGMPASGKKDYTRYLDRIEEKWGSFAIQGLAAKAFKKDVRAWRDEMKGTPRAADYTIYVFKSVLKAAVIEGDLIANPLDGIESLHTADRSDVIWTPDELARLKAASSPELRTVIDIAALTGLRRGDVLSLTWAACDGAAIRWKTSKRRRAVVIPILPELRAVLDAAPRLSPIVCLSSLKRPWTPEGLKTAWRRALDRCEIEKRFHDLRGTAATKLHAAGVERDDIAKIMGWSRETVDQIIDLYVGDDAMVARVVAAIQFQRPVSQ